MDRTVRVESVLNADADAVWERLQRTETVSYVLRPWIRLPVLRSYTDLPREGDSLTGTFDGLADGSRVAVWGEDWDTGDREIIGTFAITYDYAKGEVLLSNFAAIPEPGTTLLFGLGLATLLWSGRRKATR